MVIFIVKPNLAKLQTWRDRSAPPRWYRSLPPLGWPHNRLWHMILPISLENKIPAQFVGGKKCCKLRKQIIL